jgi:hypothetical protein
VIIYLGKEVYQKKGVGCFVDMGVIDCGYGCGKIPCIYIKKMAAAYMGYSRLFANDFATPVATLQHYSCNKILPIIMIIGNTIALPGYSYQ